MMKRLLFPFASVLAFALAVALLALPWEPFAAYAGAPSSSSNADIVDGEEDPDEEDPDADDSDDDDDPDDDDEPPSEPPPEPPPPPQPPPPLPPNPSPATDDDPPHGPDNPPEGTTADPVGYISGNVYETVTDLRIPCPDIDLVFRRGYSSRSDATGDLGYGWTHSYEWHVKRSNGKVVVRAAGETGASDAAHTFDAVEKGQTVANADGFWLSRHSGGRYTLTTPQKTRYAFSGSGRLASVTTWNGTRIDVLRGEDDRIRCVRHANGRKLEFAYSEDGALVRVSTPDLAVWVEFVQRADSGQRCLERVVRHDGDRASTNAYAYVGRPRPGKWTPPALSKGGGGGGGFIRVVSKMASSGIGEGRPSILVPVLSCKTNANGMAASFEYDRLSEGAKVRCCRMEMSDGLFACEFSYCRNYTEECKPTAFGVSRTVYRYDDRHRETARQTGSEQLLTSYDSKGNVAWTVRMNAQHALSVLRTYDGRHRNVSVATAFDAAPARVTRFGWDDVRGVMNRVVTPEGRVREWTTNGFDVVEYGAGRNDARLVTYRVCDTNGHVQAVLGPDGGRTDVAYHPDGSVAAVETEGLPRVAYAYDALGHVAAVTRPGPGESERTVSHANNWRGKPTEVSYPDGTSESLAYDGEGTKIVRRVDALGREDVYRWTLGLPVHAARVVGGVTNALYAVSHDPQLNVVAIDDPLGRRAEFYVLDENERVVAVTNLEGQVLRRTYALGSMVASETRFDGTSVAYGYGADANLATVAYPDGTLRFGYDGDGLMTSAEGAAGLVSNAYDAATGWLDASRGADGSWVRYVRSDGGAVTARVSVAGTSAYAYDKAGRRVRSVSPAGTLAFGHCPWNGLLAAVTNANGVVTAYAYDVMDRVTNVTWTARDGTALGSFTYAYDAIGRIVAREHALGTNRFDRAYAYDDLDRLVSDDGVSYAYDAAGNRTAKRGDAGGDVAYALGAGDRLASWTGGAYEHDAAGCVTRIVRGADTWDLTWNGQYQLVSVATNGVFAESYAYDALGRRAATTSSAGTERHVYDESWQVIADIDESGHVIRAYEWGEGIDQLLAVKIGSRTYTALTDVQGTVWGYADEGGAVVAHWTYDAWGNVLSEEIAEGAEELRAVRYRFQGRERSAATGLVNFRMRWYDPVTGRWLSKDPIGLSGGLNLYAFCEGNPILRIDPQGESAASVAITVVALSYLIYKLIKHAKSVNDKMKGRDVDDLCDVVNGALDVCSETMSAITSPTGMMPDEKSPLIDPLISPAIEKMWNDTFDRIRPLD